MAETTTKSTPKKPSWPSGSTEKTLREKALKVETLLQLRHSEVLTDYNDACRYRRIIGPNGIAMDDKEINKELDELIKKYNLQYLG